METKKIIVVFLLFCCIACIVLNWIHVMNYQKSDLYRTSWQFKYFDSHFNLALKATDQVTANEELIQGKIILETFPKSGNYEVFWKNPKSELSMAWKSYSEIVEYSASLLPLTDPYEINHGMEELRVRLGEWKSTRYSAYQVWFGWGVGLFGTIAILLILFIAAGVFGGIIIFSFDHLKILILAIPWVIPIFWWFILDMIPMGV